jgi:uncharacterized hydantoinase/oxoprolinase family protein
MIDDKSDPGAWADHIAITGRFRTAAEETVTLQRVVEEQDAVIGVLRTEVARMRNKCALLQKYVGHRSACYALDPFEVDRSCTCGLDEALRGEGT